MEERTIRLEERVEHLQADVAEIRVDIRRIDGKLEAVKESVSSLEKKIDLGFAAMKNEIDLGFAGVSRAQLRERIWWLAIAATILSVMARGFHWI
jgi:chromosome segregation ATPase